MCFLLVLWMLPAMNAIARQKGQWEEKAHRTQSLVVIKKYLGFTKYSQEGKVCKTRTFYIQILTDHWEAIP